MERESNQREGQLRRGVARETKADFRFERLSQWLNACASQGARHRTNDENEDENSERRKGKE